MKKNFFYLVTICLTGSLIYLLFFNNSNIANSGSPVDRTNDYSASTPAIETSPKIEKSTPPATANNNDAIKVEETALLEELELSDEIERALEKIDQENDLTNSENAELEAKLADLEKQLEAQIEKLESNAQ